MVVSEVSHSVESDEGDFMPTVADELLKHQYIYVPWNETEHTSDLGVGIALHLQRQHRLPLTVVVSLKSNIPDELRKCDSVSERSGYADDGGVVLAYYPTYKVLEKIRHLSKSAVVMLEFPTESQEGWARLHGAYNVTTGEVIHAELTDGDRETLKQIVFEGYEGWHDDIAERSTLRLLGDLDKATAYDRELVLAFARETKSEQEIERLAKLLDRSEASHTADR